MDKRPRGRPRHGEEAKVLLTLRLDVRVIDFFKAAGRGWQTRMANVLEEYVRRENGG